MKMNHIVSLLIATFSVALALSTQPTEAPSVAPSVTPTIGPSVHPTESPSVHPSVHPTESPSVHPSVHPTESPSVTPTVTPSIAPSVIPTIQPSVIPTVKPTISPTVKPTIQPSITPTVIPTVIPTVKPTVVPTVTPTVIPTVQPSIKPTVVPTIQPSIHPTETPSEAPTFHPTITGPGWLNEYYYTVNNTADPVIVYGRRTGECLEGEFFYYSVACGTDRGYANILIFSDWNCTNQVQMYQVTFAEEYTTPYGPKFAIDNLWTYSTLANIHYVQYECTTDSEQYSFATTYENTTYAVTEFFSRGDQDDDNEYFQCRNDYTMFAAYRKNFCYSVEQFEDGPIDENYFMFTARDDTFIRFEEYDNDNCEGFGRVTNLFQVDDCAENDFTIDDDFKDVNDWGGAPLTASKKDKRANRRHSRKMSAPSATFLTAMGNDVIATMTGKPIGEAKVKETQGMGDFYGDYAAEYPNLYFTDDDNKDFYDDDFYYSQFNGPAKYFPILSSYYLWTNVPALDADTPEPMKWFSEVITFETSDDSVPGIVNTRKTMTCMPFYWAEEILFNYEVICEDSDYSDDLSDQIHVLQYSASDYTCSGDYYITNFLNYYFGGTDDSIGRQFYRDIDDYYYECSNERFGSRFNESIAAGYSYSTEIFYPLTATNTSECTDSFTDITMGVAFLQDYCFTFFADYYTNDDHRVSQSMSYEYEANLDTQEIEFTVYLTKDCRNRWLHQTKEIEINTCSNEQPNTFYNPIQKFGPQGDAVTAAHKVSEEDRSLVAKAMNHHSNSQLTVGTPFTNMLESKARDVVKKRNDKAAAKAKRAAKRAAKKQGVEKNAAADKEVETVSNSYSYYYYFDDANTLLNNRPGAMMNMWFSIPTTPTIAPTVVPTVVPSEVPSAIPTVEPSIEPSIAPSEIPTIQPSMAPNPPTLRPTPRAGQPTFSPTHQVTYSFSVYQQLDGIDAATFEANENNTIAFKEAAAMAIPPLTADNIDIYEIEDYVASRRLRKLADGTTQLTYSITFTVAETGYTDIETAYSALTNSLTTAIIDTDLFNGYIQVAAAENSFNAPDLLSTTTDSYTADEYAQVSTDDDSKPNTKSHYQTIVGVVVGLGGGLLLIMLIYFCIFGCGTYSADRSSAYAPPSTVNHSAAVEATQTDDKTAV